METRPRQKMDHARTHVNPSSGADALVGFGDLDVVKEWVVAAHT